MKKHYNIKIEVRRPLILTLHILMSFRTQKGKCRKFAAIENWNSLKYKGQVVTGVMMVFCRHGLVRPDSATNLVRGEK